MQEQLNNIDKYAKADKIELTINMNDEFAELIIQDNGVGFNTDLSTSGIGLSNIRNRAEALNGYIEIIFRSGRRLLLVIAITT